MLYTGPLTLLLAFPFSVWAAPTCRIRPSGSAAASSTAPSSTPSASGGSSTNNGGNRAGDFVSTTWFAGWHGDAFPPEKMSWSKYTSATYAFATTVDDPGSVGNLDAENVDLLKRFVSLAQQNNVKALLTIGGWTGSAFFSTNVGSAANRTQFVQTMVGLVNTYNLDGLDFDWEYPGRTGADCNIIAPNDSANFLTFLQELRATPEMSNRLITAATAGTPFVGADGQPMSDVSDYAKVLDYVAIMNYDVWGTWSSAVGPNAPLDDTCAASADQQGSAVSFVQAWTQAGFPANQLVLGVASYGHSFTVTTDAALVSQTPSANGTLALNAYPAFSKEQPKGDSWDEYAPASTTSCGTPVPAGYSGIFDFWGLQEGGFLDTSGNPVDGIGYRFDSCSQTPYVYNTTTQVMVSFDNAQSFAAKGNFIKDKGLLGFAMWEAGGDMNDILLDSISQASGFQQKSSRR